MTTLNLVVASSSDDANETAGGTVTIDTTSANITSTGAWVGARFNSVTISSGDTIDSATPYLYSGNATNDDFHFEVFGEDEDDAGTFTTDADSISTRTLTTASADWSADNTGTGYIAGPDIAAVIQEIIDRAGWSSGNDLVLIYDAETDINATINFYDNDTGQAPKLDIDYTESGGGGDDGGGEITLSSGTAAKAATYEIWLTDSLGNTLDVIDDWFYLSYTRAVNDIGGLELQLNGNYPLSNIKLDGRILVYRDGRLEIDAPWLIRKWEKSLDADGRRTLTLYGVSANEILTRRIVAAAPDDPDGTISDYPDNAMKRIVRANFVGPDLIGAGEPRNISAYLSCEADASLGISACKTFGWANAFDVFQEITQTSIQAGSPVYFDVVSTTSSGLEFRTYRGLRGINHTFPGGINPVTLSPDYGNLSNVTLSFDRSQEVTVAYVGIQGVGSERIAGIGASSATRATESPLNYREIFIQANNTSSSDSGISDAQAALRAGRPLRTFEGELVNVPGTCEYRVHWSLGDAVTVSFDGDSFDCTIDSVTVTVQGGKEEINGTLRVEEE